MRPLSALSVRFVAIVAAVVVGVGVFGGVVRLLPWFVAPNVPWRLTVPFARALLSPLLEATIVVALPVGATLAASVFVERGEARALLSLGAAPGELVRGLLWPGLMVVVVAAGAARMVPVEGPGPFARNLIDTARASCTDGSRRRRVDLPLLSVAWLCLSDGPWLAGRVPGVTAPVWFSASALAPEADFAAVTLKGTHLAGQFGEVRVRLQARDVRISGLSRWGAPSPAFKGEARALVVATGALAVAVFASWLVLRRRGPISVPLFAAVSAGASAAMLAALHALDRHAAPGIAYVLAPAVGCAVALSGFAVVSRQWRVAWRRAR